MYAVLAWFVLGVEHFRTFILLTWRRVSTTRVYLFLAGCVVFHLCWCVLSFASRFVWRVAWVSVGGVVGAQVYVLRGARVSVIMVCVFTLMSRSLLFLRLFSLLSAPSTHTPMYTRVDTHAVSTMHTRVPEHT